MRSSLARAILRLDHLAHALAAGVVNVIGGSSAAQIHLLQLVLEIPVHLHRVHGRHAAVNVVALGVFVGVGLDVVETIADRRPRQPVTLL